jgi:hypothetical protein
MVREGNHLCFQYISSDKNKGCPHFSGICIKDGIFSFYISTSDYPPGVALPLACPTGLLQNQ